MTDLPDFNLKDIPKPKKLDLDAMSQAELIELRGKIDAKLTGLSLIDVNLVKETLIQLQKAKILQIRASDPKSGTPVNQQAQVQNSIAKILGDLGKLQGTLFDSEQRKRLQAATVKAIRTLPVAAQDKFFELYSVILDDAKSEMENMVGEDLVLPPEEDDESEAVGDIGRV